MIELIVLIGLIFLAWIVFTTIVSFTLGIIELVIAILVWMLIGWLAGQILRGKSYGPVYDALLGLGGAIIGGIILTIAGVSISGLLGTIIGGVIGALILVSLIRMFKDKNFAR